MASKKRQQRQLQRRRRIERDASTRTATDSTSDIGGEKPRGNQPNTKKGKELARNQTKSDTGNGSFAAEHSLADFVWSRASTWWRQNALFVVNSTDYSFSPKAPTAASAVAIVGVLVASLMVGNHDALKQVMTINHASITTVVIASLFVSVVLPFVLLKIRSNPSRIDETRAQNDGAENTIGNDSIEKPEGIDDEFSTIRPLGLKRPSMDAAEDETMGGFERNSPPPTSKLAASVDVRIKLAEWLPFGLRHTSDLNLVFSTDVDGRSLQTLYHKLGATSSNHTILLLEAFSPGSSAPLIVGMYASHRWHFSSKIYGNGQSFLFRMLPSEGDDTAESGADKGQQSECWKWTPMAALASSTDSKHSTSSSNSGNNNNENALALWETFQRSNHDCLRLGIGASGVGAGLSLNHDLTRGDSCRAVGFDNEPLVEHSGGGAFDVGLVEVYQLVREIDGRPIR
jgi:hypothetical protein